MPGIADSPQAQLQVNSLPAVNSRPDVDVSNIGTVPSFDTFMDAYRKGVITAEDIKRRAVVGTSPYEAERATHEANQALAEQAKLNANEIQPKQRELQSQQLSGATNEQSLLNRINSPDTSVSYPAREEYANKLLDAQATAVYGNPQPDLYKSTERQPEDFDTWVARQANAFQGTDEARAAYVNHLRERGEKGEEYAKYKDAIKNEKTPIPKGTPEYRRALREHVHQAMTYEQLQQLNFDVLKESAIAKGKAQAELPVTQQKAGSALRTEYSQLPQVHDFEKVDASYNKILAATDPNVPSTPLRDQAAIFSWMKVLDPGSTVREGEYASVKNAKGIPDQVRNAYNQALSGQILTVEQRREMREAVGPQFQAQVANLAPRIKQYVDQEQRNGLPKGTVVPLEHQALLEQGTMSAKVAPTAAPAPKAQATPQEVSGAQVYPSLSAVPANVRVFKTTDGRLLVNPNYKL